MRKTHARDQNNPDNASNGKRMTERDPIYIALELNEVRLLERMLEDYLREADPYSSAGSAEDSY